MDNSGAFERDLGGASMAEESKATDWTDDQLEPSWVVDTEEIRRPNSGKVTLASDAHSDLTEKVRHSKHRDKRRSEGTSTSPRTSRSSTREQRRSSHSSPTASPRTSNGSSPGRKERHERSRESSRRSEKDRRESRSRQSHLVRPGGVRLAGPAEIERPRRPSRLSTQSNTSNSSSNSSRASRAPVRYSVTELVQTLGNEKSTHEMDPELQRRVLDFRLAQQKRREKYGEHGKTGIFGMYAHLSDVRCDLEWSEDAAWRRKHGHPYLSWTDFDAVRQKTAHRSWFTYFIIFICSIMLIVEFGLNDWKVAPLIVNPLVGPSPQALIEAGARVTPLIVEDGQWFRIFSPLFLHAGIIHFFLNMAALWFIGAAVEQSHGIANAIILFFVPGIGGNILSAIFLPQYISVGASGGIFGLVGGCVADIALNWNLLFIKSGEEDNKTKRRNIVAIVWIAADMLINIIVGFTPYVDNFAHLGGFVYGVCCGLTAIEPLAVGFFGVHSTPWEKIRTVFVRFFGLIFSVILIIVTTALLATMDLTAPPCSNCRYVSCVPFPFWREQRWWYCDDCDQVSATLYKNADGDDYYDSVDLTCPNGDIEVINISNQTLSDREEVRHKLAGYCREFCDDSFA